MVYDCFCTTAAGSSVIYYQNSRKTIETGILYDKQIDKLNNLLKNIYLFSRLSFNVLKFDLALNNDNKCTK